MTQERLLKRLRHWGRREIPVADLAGYTESVLEDLDRLYNTQQGTALIDSQYGMPDFTALFNTLTPPEVDRIERALRHATEKYEPRLAVSSVRHTQRTADFGVLRFAIEARLNFRGEQLPLTVYAVLGGEGRWRVQT